MHAWKGRRYGVASGHYLSEHILPTSKLNAGSGHPSIWE